MTGYLKVSRIAAHVENKTLRIQLKDACRCVWKVTFRIEADGLLRCEVLRDFNFGVLINSAESVDTHTHTQIIF